MPNVHTFVTAYSWGRMIPTCESLAHFYNAHSKFSHMDMQLLERHWAHIQVPIDLSCILSLQLLSSYHFKAPLAFTTFQIIHYFYLEQWRSCYSFSFPDNSLKAAFSALIWEDAVVIDFFWLSCAYQLCKKLLSPQKRVVDGVHNLSVHLLEKDGAVQVILWNFSLSSMQRA